MSRKAVASTTLVPFAEPLLLPVSEAARLLSISEYSVRLLARKSKLTYKKLSHSHWLITTASIKKFASEVVA